MVPQPTTILSDSPDMQKESPKSFNLYGANELLIPASSPFGF